MRFVINLAAALLLLTVPAVASAQTPPLVDTNNPPPALTHQFGSQANVEDGLPWSAKVASNGAQHTDGEGEPDEKGAYRMACAPGPVIADDPVVYPGMPGESHAHQLIGNTGVNAFSTYASLRTTGESTCHGPGWRSGYWQNAVVRGDGTVVRPAFITVYYKRAPLGSPECTPGNPAFAGRCIPLPNGIKFVAGFDFLTNTINNGSTLFKCVVYTQPNLSGAVEGPEVQNLVDAAHGCPNVAGKAYIDLAVNAPECVQGDGNGGIRLDSPNHRSHTSIRYYDNQGHSKCPATHPYMTWGYTYQAFFEVDNTLDRSGTWECGRDTWYMSTDRSNGKHSMSGLDKVWCLKPGTTFHFDLDDAADENVKRIIEANCINRHLNCSGGDLGDGQRLVQTQIATVQDPQVNRIVKRPKLRYETWKTRVKRDK